MTKDPSDTGRCGKCGGELALARQVHVVGFGGFTVVNPPWDLPTCKQCGEYLTDAWRRLFEVSAVFVMLRAQETEDQRSFVLLAGRKALKLEPAQMASALGCTAEDVRAWEQGDSKPPQIAVDKLSNLLKSHIHAIWPGKRSAVKN